MLYSFYILYYCFRIVGQGIIVNIRITKQRYKVIKDYQEYKKLIEKIKKPIKAFFIL